MAIIVIGLRDRSECRWTMSSVLGDEDAVESVKETEWREEGKKMR